MVLGRKTTIHFTPVSNNNRNLLCNVFERKTGIFRVVFLGDCATSFQEMFFMLFTKQIKTEKWARTERVEESFSFEIVSCLLLLMYE